MTDSTIYVATETFTTTLDGAPVVIQKDVTRVRAGHKLMKGREAFFKPLEVQYDVEQATAAPAESRKASPYVKKAKEDEPEPEPEPTPEPEPES